MQPNKVVVGRDEMDRLIMMRMDVDRYETETIAVAQQSETRCTCGLEAATGNRRPSPFLA
jgi:hypothetical protein